MAVSDQSVDPKGRLRSQAEGVSRVELEVVPTTAPLGAEVRSVDLRSIDDAMFAEIYRTWLERSVVLFRNQQLSDADLIAFSRRFGALDQAPIQENGRRRSEEHTSNSSH